METTVVENKVNGTEKQSAKTSETKVLQIESLSIAKINPDPNQPRKTYSEVGLQNLSETIKEFGLIQPITVRHWKKGNYVIVSGERRYRACKLLKWKNIDCIVKDVDADIVSEIQIIENLQREDVEPIEEAEAIALLRKKYSPKEISQRIGRSEKFIRQRTKLADLIPEFRQYLVDENLTLGKAMGLANFDEEEQREIFEGMIQQCQEFNLNYINRACEEMRFDLNKAPFDINDSELLITAGACGGCPFNSITQGALFGDDKPICSKPSCYQNKKFKHFLTLLDKVKSDGTIFIPIIREYDIDEDENQLIISYMEQNGFTVYLPSDVRIMYAPEKPTIEQLKKQFHWKTLTDQEWNEELKKAEIEYRDDMKAYKAAPSNGFVKASLFNTTNYSVEDALVKLEDEEENEKESIANTIPVSDKTMAQCTPKEQITKLEKREERKVCIENNKMFQEIAKSIRETDYINLKKALTADEMVAFTIILLEDCTKYGTFKKEQMSWDEKSRKKNKLDVLADYKGTFKKEMLNKVIRNLILQQCHFGEDNHTNNIVNSSVYSVMKATYAKEVEAIEKAYEAKRKERTKKLKSRIQGLKAEIKELEV